jgi:hypothetical protein
VFVATRRTVNSVPEATWSELYGRAVVIGGLNVSLLDWNLPGIIGMRVDQVDSCGAQ